MVSSRKNGLAVLTLFVLLSIASAFEADGFFFRRQNTIVGTGVSTSPSSSPSDTPTPSSSSPSDTPTSNTPTPSSSPSNTPTPSATPSSTPAPSTTPSAGASSSGGAAASSTPSSSPTSSGHDDSTSSTKSSKTSSFSPSVFTSALVSSETQKYVTTIVQVSGSQTFLQAVTSNRVIPVTTGFVTGTTTPSVQDGDHNGGSSGLSSKSKGIIGGVVGGIGGAILLGGIIFAVWRVWGRKRHQLDDDEDIMSSTTAHDSEMRQNAGGAAPFQSTLDQYHQPPRNVNAAANF